MRGIIVGIVGEVRIGVVRLMMVIRMIVCLMLDRIEVCYRLVSGGIERVLRWNNVL